jgi:hypothetical protein
MSTLGTLKNVLEIVRIIVEVVALIVAGMWAYSKFVEAERPSLEVRGHVQSDLKWFPALDPDHCLGQFGVTLRNIGKISFDVDTVRLRIWIVTFPAANTEVALIDPMRFQAGAPAIDAEMKIGSLATCCG